MQRPPCAPARGALNSCARSLYEAKVHGNLDLAGAWSGWRIAGGQLRDPDGQRLSLARLRYLMMQERHRGVPLAPPLLIAQQDQRGASNPLGAGTGCLPPSGPASRL